MAREQCSDPGTLIAGANLQGAKMGSLLRLETGTGANGEAVLTSAATDVVVAILRQDLPTGKNTTGQPIPVWPINKAFQLPVLMGAAGASGRLLVPDASSGNNGKATTVADVAGLATNQVSFGQLIEAATAEDDQVTMLANVVTG